MSGIVSASTGLVSINGKPLEKMVRNPMLDYPPFWKCWCGKESQAKKCCLPKMALTIPESELPLGQKYMAYVKENFGKETHL